ncbi:MAG: YbaB/EbfC family nucleoid-associated protein [Myxococcota bacterium]
MSQPDMSELLKRAQEMQERMAELQRDLARRTAEGSSGGGMVTAVATGELRILEIRIEPELISSGDQAMLQDLIAAAANAALANAQRMVQEEMQKAGGPLQMLQGQS